MLDMDPELAYIKGQTAYVEIVGNGIRRSVDALRSHKDLTQTPASQGDGEPDDSTRRGNVPPGSQSGGSSVYAYAATLLEQPIVIGQDMDLNSGTVDPILISLARTRQEQELAAARQAEEEMAMMEAQQAEAMALDGSHSYYRDPVLPMEGTSGYSSLVFVRFL